MADIIYIGDDTSATHGAFVAWLNELLTSYTSGFWDVAVDGMVTGAFIDKNYGYMQEMYSPDGVTLQSFMTVTPTNEVAKGLMIHDPITGVPFMYTYDLVDTIFTFTDEGLITGFTANVTIDIKNADDSITHEVYIGYKILWGVQMPFFYVVDKATSTAVSQGVVDVHYIGRLSPSYAVKNVPTDATDIIKIKNIGQSDLRVEFPVFKGYFMSLNMKPNTTELIPYTKLSISFSKELAKLGSILYIIQKA